MASVTRNGPRPHCLLADSPRRGNGLDPPNNQVAGVHLATDYLSRQKRSLSFAGGRTAHFASWRNGVKFSEFLTERDSGNRGHARFEVKIRGCTVARWRRWAA